MANAFHYQNTFRDDLADEFSSVLAMWGDPSEIADLEAWYDGDDPSSLAIVNDQVTQWQDKSGNSWHLGPVAGKVLPVISGSQQNGRNGIFFDYAEKAMLESNYTASGTGSLTAFIAAKRASPASEYGGGSVYKSILSIGRPDGTSAEIGKFNIAEDRDSGNVLTNAHKVSAINNGNGIMRDGKAHIITTALLYDTQFSLTGRLDGLLGELDDRTDIAAADDLTPLQVGGSTSASSRRFWGTIYEILLFSRNLTAEEIRKVESYLSTKWAIPLQS